MDFEFNDQQLLIRDTFRRFLDGRAPEASAQPVHFDSEYWRQLADLGLFALLVPERFGGHGLKLIDVALVIEELGRALTNALVSETLMATDLIVRYGNDTQRSALLPRVAAGRLRVTSAVLEPDSGFGTSRLATQAKEAHNGSLLEGVKILVPEAANADLVMVATRTGDADNLALMLLEPGRRGIGLREQVTLDPSSRLSELTLSAVELAPEDWLGGLSLPAGGIDRLLDLASTSAALQMMGIAGKVLELSTTHATDRIQFGKPIGAFQAIKHKCADMAVAIEAGRAAAYFAAWALSEAPAQAGKAVSIAKSFAGDTVSMVCNEGTQIHGGMGFTWELGLHFYLRRAKLLEYSAGDSTHHRERVLRETLAELGLS